MTLHRNPWTTWQCDVTSEHATTDTDLSASVERQQVPLHHGEHPRLGRQRISNPRHQINTQQYILTVSQPSHHTHWQTQRQTEWQQVPLHHGEHPHLGRQHVGNPSKRKTQQPPSSHWSSQWLSLPSTQHIHWSAYSTAAISHINWLTDWVVVLRPTRHKTGHFRDDSPSKISSLGIEKTKPNTTKAHIHQSKEMYYKTK